MKTLNTNNEIPKDLEGCFKALNNLLTQDQIDEFKSLDESDRALLHFGLGRWLRNTWGLWNGSRLKDYFNNLGILHADDMSGIILKCYQRHLMGEDLKMEEEVNFYKDYWKNQDKSK